MASLSISSIADVFPATTTVGAYPASGWSQAALPPSGAPPVSATASGTVASNGSLSITGLADGTLYYLGASVSGTWRFRRARTSDSAAGNSVLAPAASGVAATDTAALQALFDQGSATAPILIDLPPKQNYSITELVPRSGVILRGNGSKLTATAASTQGIITNRTLQAPVDRFEVYGVEFVGEGQTVGDSTERRGGVYVYNGSRIVVRDCLAHDFSDHAFGVRNSEDCRIQDNTVWNVCNWFLGNAIEFSSALASHTTAPQPATRGVISGNVVVNCRTAPVCVQSLAHQSEMTGTDPASVAVVPTPVKDYDVVVCDNPFLEAMVEDVANHGFAAIALEIARYGSAGDTTQGNKMGRVHVHHNHCCVHGTSGSTSPTTWGISVSDNNSSNGPQSTDSDEFSDIVLDHNTIDSVDGGIMCQASRAVIDHNVIRADKRGIVVAYNNTAGHLPEQILVDANNVQLDATKAVGPGVYSLTTAHTTVQGNRINFYGSPANGQSAAADGIQGNGSSSLIVKDNTVRGATRHGINLLTVTGYAVDRNRVVNSSSAATNTYHALYLNGVTGDTNTKGNVRHNDLIDDRGGSNMMAQALSINGGSPRAYIVGNRMFGYTSFPVSLSAANVWWWQDNDTSGSLGPFGNQAITPSGSPYTYTVSGSGTNPFRQKVIVSGGTVSAITVKHGSGAAVTTGVTAGEFLLGLNDAIAVTYTVAPTMTAIAV